MSGTNGVIKNIFGLDYTDPLTIQTFEQSKTSMYEDKPNIGNGLTEHPTIPAVVLGGTNKTLGMALS